MEKPMSAPHSTPPPQDGYVVSAQYTPYADPPQAHSGPQYVVPPVQGTPYAQPFPQQTPQHPQPYQQQPPQPQQSVGEVPTTFPADADGPLFIGSSASEPILVTCPQCGYTGQSKTKKKAGVMYGVFAMVTFGLGAFSSVAKDTHHYCQQCDKHLAYSKHQL
mmetsp:Transcript_4371/g.7439  ORF Transcript_4371/g.7439 Transcript_4371/m.7439 type:complete len:162 (+) Transcript_4371:175-660(+)|eukprot:CAMPEP_0198205998 /NCGR_PEP_ID=MMETSP1445-20131203/9531_1 /TAXON_ID=36898 /ORGANISM="Pyramimonas sp., Strain CCMP2087" /LENGTH=161 /DNA_ID=CAMNT_0043878515 /DNA_START=172 /DNA_END=657 /DNA_ORIENTATION=-